MSIAEISQTFLTNWELHKDIIIFILEKSIPWLIYSSNLTMAIYKTFFLHKTHNQTRPSLYHNILMAEFQTIKGYFFYQLPDRTLVNRKMKKRHRKRYRYYVFRSFHTKLNLLSYVSEILLKLSDNPQNWQRTSFIHYKEFNQTAKVRTQLYLIMSDIIQRRNFPFKSLLIFSVEAVFYIVIISLPS